MCQNYDDVQEIAAGPPKSVTAYPVLSLEMAGYRSTAVRRLLSTDLDDNPP
jgi:hypothetical protein